MKKSLYYYLLLTAIVAGIVLAARSQSDKPKVDTAYKSIRTYAITDIPTNDSFLIPIDTIIKRHTQDLISIDTPKVRYQYFYNAQIGIPEWQKAADTLDLLLRDFGRSMSVDQADQYRSLFVRQIRKLQFSVDSIKLEKPKK